MVGLSTINRHAQQITGTVIANKRIGAYHQILLGIGPSVTTVRPGNFIAVRVGGEDTKMVLRRAFAISRVSESTSFGGTLELIIAPHGSGSRWFCSQGEGAELDVIVPLGKAFGIPTEPAQALLVGGGYGSAPLFGLAEVLRDRGCRVEMILGASTGSKIYAPMEGKRSVSSLKIFTEDGSMGEKGVVTTPIRSMIDEGRVDVIYSCGPMAMLRAISRLVEGSDVVHQCSVEESMACGIGICMTCVLPVKMSDGAIANLRSCIDGPVMDGADVCWDEVGKQIHV